MQLFRRLFCPDVHAPFHDRRAFQLMLDVGRDFRPDEIVIHGDFFDCLSVSAYTQDPQRAYRVLREELDEARGTLLELERVLKPKSIVFIEGNHENRIQRYVFNNAAKLGGLVETRDVLGVPKHYRWVPWGPKNFYRCGPHLVATHGSLASQHVAAAMVRRYGTSVIFGHTHRIQEFNVRTVHGQRHKGLTIGWLGDVDRAADYVENVADWSHGFALGYFTRERFFIDVIEIENYQAIYNGRFCEPKMPVAR